VQVLMMWLVLAASYVNGYRRDRRVPVDDIGLFWLAVLTLYATLPSLSWLLQGGYYGPLSGTRLLRLQPVSTDIIYLLNIALAYSGGFAIVYFIVGRQIPAAVPQAQPRISGAKMAGALAIVLAFQITMLVLNVGGFMGSPDSYIDSYRVVQQLPLAMRQVLKIGGGIAAVATLVLLISILQRWPSHRYLFFFYIGVVLFSFDPEGSRAPIATGLFAIAIAWHVIVRPLSARWWVCAGSLGLLVFLVLGLLREVSFWTDYGALSPDGVGVGEFDALWANALELLQTRESGGRIDVPNVARFGELWAFVPSQVLPFQKLSLADWFVQTFYPAYFEAGGGWAFGAIAQAVIGGGVLEAILRGSILGALAGWIMKWYRTPGGGWWRFPFYIYLLVFVFQSIRDTTFRLVSEAVQTALPAFVLIAVAAMLLGSGSKTADQSAGSRC
jgi:hypothetical protein